MSGIQDFYRVRLGEAIQAGDTTPLMVFPCGQFHSAKYPNLALTEDLANEIIANFTANVLGREPVVDSSGRHDVSSPAAGWVKRCYLASYEEGDVNGLALWADVQWTSLGAQLLTDSLYKYSSVEIGPVVLNDSGDTVDNVLRSLTLTNTPVLSMMGDVKDAAEKLKVVATLSEITLSTHEDDGNPAVPTSGSSGDVSQPAKVGEGHDVTLAEGDAAPKGSDHMKTVATKLNLAEDATEATILAEVTKLAEHDAAETARANAAEATLAETAKKAATDAFAVKLDEKITGGFIATGERETFVELAEKQSVELAETLIGARTSKVVDLTERGTSGEGEDGGTYADASVELAEKAKARAAKDGSTYTAAEKLVLAEDSGLADRYSEFRMNPRKEA